MSNDEKSLAINTSSFAEPVFAIPVSGYQRGVICVGLRRGGRHSAGVGWRHEAPESDANNGKRSAS
jgi:hypothetical protein